MDQTQEAVDPPAPADVYVRPPYDPLTILLHWTTVILVLAQFASALSIDQFGTDWIKPLLTLHRSTGVLLWSVVAFRLLWRFTGMTLPPFPPKMAGWHVAGVHLSEYGLYALLLIQPATGLADGILRGRPFPLFFSQFPAVMARNRQAAALAHTLHAIGAYTLAGVVTVHALAALFHHLVPRDGVLRSMTPGAGSGGAG